MAKYTYRGCKGCRSSPPGNHLLSEASQRRQSTHKKAIQSSFNLSRQGESSIYVEIPPGRRLRGPESRTHSWIEKKQNCQVFPALRTSSFIPAVLARPWGAVGGEESLTPLLSVYGGGAAAKCLGRAVIWPSQCRRGTRRGVGSAVTIYANSDVCRRLLGSALHVLRFSPFSRQNEGHQLASVATSFSPKSFRLCVYSLSVLSSTLSMWRLNIPKQFNVITTARR